MTWASTYTHEPVRGQRVDQYALPVQPVAPYRSDFQRSGYRSYRSSLQVGQSADNFQVVEQWGRQVIPYEQWRFPYRPYAVPYGAWGPQAPYGILNGSIGYGGYPGAPYYNANPNGPGSGNPGAGNPGLGNPYAGPYYHPGYGSRGFPLQPRYNHQPWYDGNYPSAPPLDPRSDKEFFYDPIQ